MPTTIRPPAATPDGVQALFLAGLLLCLSAPALAAQAPQAVDPAGDGIPLVFLDCPGFLCDFDFLRREIAWVDWIRERLAADVHLLVTEEDTGGGGERITFDFIGQGRFDGVDRRLTHATNPTQTESETREDVARMVALGLVNYGVATPAAGQLQVEFEGEAETPEAGLAQVDDPWDLWVFEVDVGGDVESEERRTEISFDGGLAASRTTPGWKLDFGVDVDYSEQRFDLDEGEEVSIQRDVRFRSLAVRSLGAHWSAGLQASVERTTDLNQDLALRGGPALEFNLFPYEESSRRQLTVLYALSGASFEYQDTTVFLKLSERRGSQLVNVSLDLQEQWGEVGLSLEGSHYLSELQQNRLTLSGDLEIQLFRGLSVDLGGSASRLRDQIYLPREEATNTDVIIGSREFATDFELEFRIGLSYTFGSIFSNVVNPRFASLGGGGGDFDQF